MHLGFVFISSAGRRRDTELKNNIPSVKCNGPEPLNQTKFNSEKNILDFFFFFAVGVSESSVCVIISFTVSFDSE